MPNYTFSDIVKLNKEFYESTAKQFSVTRAYPWKGWGEILPFISHDNDNIKNYDVLDLGCGNGRFYEFLAKNITNPFSYVGVDFSTELINEAKHKFTINDVKNNMASENKVNFLEGDFFEYINTKNSNELDVDSSFSLVAGFGIMHHIFSSEKQKEFISNCCKLLKKNGFLVLTFWIHQPEPAKILENLNNNDYILNWDNNKNKKRFIHTFNEPEVNEIFEKSVIDYKIKIVSRYKSDGKNNESNLYIVAQKG